MLGYKQHGFELLNYIIAWVYYECEECTLLNFYFAATTDCNKDWSQPPHKSQQQTRKCFYSY